MRPIMRMFVLMGVILVSIGMEAKYLLIGRLVNQLWFVKVCTLVLIILVILFVLVSLFRVLKERELEASARQLFADGVPRLDPGKQDLHIMLSMAGERQRDESEVFTVVSDEENRANTDKWYSFNLIDKFKKGRRISHG